MRQTNVNSPDGPDEDHFDRSDKKAIEYEQMIQSIHLNEENFYKKNHKLTVLET